MHSKNRDIEAEERVLKRDRKDVIQHLINSLSNEIQERVMANPYYKESISTDNYILLWTSIHQIVSNSISNQPLEVLAKWNDL